MISQFYPPTVGGEERMVYDLSVELVKRGHRVAVLTLRQEGMPDYEVVEGVHLYRTGSSAARLASAYHDPQRRHAPPAPDPEVIAHLRDVLAYERPRVVHGHNWLAYSFLPLKRSHEPAFVLSLHDYSHVCAIKRFVYDGAPCSGPGAAKCIVCSSRHYGRWKGAAIAAANAGAKAAARRLVDLFLPVSRAVALGSGLARARRPYEIVPNFLPDDISPHIARGSLSALPESFILFVGDLSEDKGVRILLEAHAAMPTRLPLVLIGRHHERELVRASAHGVIALGPRPREQVLEAFARCTIAVVPSITPEAFGLVAIEAMALGRPVVGSNVGGLRDVVVHAETGFLVPPGQPESVRDALEALAGDPALRERMGAAGRRRAMAFSASRILPRFERAYERALSSLSG
jgi:glycosyltransferase involved in cell wall biosynthesis